LTSLVVDSYNSAMKDDTKITQRDIDEAAVRLKPILGIQPGHYLAALFSAIILAVLFLVLVLPGIRNNGRYYDFRIDPPASAIYVDGVYKGHSPCSVFIPSGEKTVLVTRSGFQAQEIKVVSKGRIAGTLFIPSRTELSMQLIPVAGNTTLTAGMVRYASWASSGTPSEAYQIPMELSEAALASTIAPGSFVVQGFAGAALSYARHAQSLRDASRAVALVYGASAAIGPLTLGRLVETLESEIAADPALLLAFAASAPVEISKKIEESDYYLKIMKELKDRRESIGQALPGTKSELAGTTFVSFGPGTAVINAIASPPSLVELKAFRMARSETTIADFRRFIIDTPAWSRAAQPELMKQGLVGPDYLKDFEASDASEPIRFISKPAAEAYCKWLSRSAPSGYRVALPTEAQWSYVASAAGSSASLTANLRDSGNQRPIPPSNLQSDAAGMRGLLGNVWEWCADPYAIHPASGMAGRKTYPNSEFVVRGGSWANRADLVNLDSRGPMPASTCSAYLGFRVVLVPESE